MAEIIVKTDELLSVGQAARMLGRPRVYIYRRIHSGEINAIKLGGVYYIPKEEIEDKQ